MSNKEQVKKCTDCGRVLPISKFAKTRKWRRNYCNKCKHTRERYGINGSEFYKLLDEQLGCCLICEEPINEHTANIDHCHNEKHVRALLCVNCNTSIGLLRYSTAIATRLIEYLNKHVP